MQPGRTRFTTNPTKLAKKVYFGVLQHPSKFQAKISTGKFYLRIKSTYPPGSRAVFMLQFGHNFPSS